MSRVALAGAVLGLVVALAACRPAAPDHAPVVTVPAEQTEAPAAPEATVVASAPAQLAALGNLRIGAAFGKAPGDKAFVSAGMRELMEGDCEYYDHGTLPAGVSMMVIADRIARFEVQNEGDPGVAVEAAPANAPPVPFALWVGMSDKQAKARLPAGLVVSPHAYVSPDGDYLTWTDKSARLALRLETWHGLVTSIYWGRPEAVELIEGCA